MENTLDETQIIIRENEKLIANVLHDIKSPLLSVKIGLQRKLDCELNCDIFETITDVLEYIENFLVDYSFKQGKFENKIAPCDIKKLINKKLENYKYIFCARNIVVDIHAKDTQYIVNSVVIFLSSIIGNIVSNIAIHASKNKRAAIYIYKKDDIVCVDFKNNYDSNEHDFSLGLDFCKNLAQVTKIDLKFSKTKNQAVVNLRIPSLQACLERQIVGI